MKITSADKFRNALATLVEFLDEPVETKRDVAGVLQGFAFTFELAWKATQDHISALGYLQRGPRPSLQAGVETGLIRPEEAEGWSSMLEDRNLVSHVYRPEWALELVERIRTQHLPLLISLAERLHPLL
ncbi:MAG: HI0074 family nucleotidyltransferase substrate-binding subunit [Fimbriimonas sp.]